MAELAAPNARLAPTFDLNRLLRIARRFFTALVMLFMATSIAVSSGLVYALALRIGGSPNKDVGVNVWLFEQAILRILLIALVVGTLVNMFVQRGSRSGSTGRGLSAIFGMIVLWLLAERVFFVAQTTPYPWTIWLLQVINGLVLGSLYALVALGYTLVYGILLMINFAHGEVVMIGSYFGFFALQLFTGNPNIFVPRGVPADQASLAATFFMMIFVLAVAMIGSTFTGLAVERVAYRPLRRAPRLAPLISAIGVSIFLQQTVQRIFGPGQRSFDKPTLLSGGIPINLGKEFGPQIRISTMGIIVFFSSLVLMAALYILIRRTRTGRAMRAVAEDKDTAALMGANVDRVIATTFALGAALAGAAGVMWGMNVGQTDPFAGFQVGLKAFTAAVLGGIGNIPGAMLGGIVLGLAETVGPSALGIPNEYKDVISFALLILILIFRPTGILGEVLAEKKV